jgi:hypothetical protein
MQHFPVYLLAGNHQTFGHATFVLWCKYNHRDYIFFTCSMKRRRELSPEQFGDQAWSPSSPNSSPTFSGIDPAETQLRCGFSPAFISPGLRRESKLETGVFA